MNIHAMLFSFTVPLFTLCSCENILTIEYEKKSNLSGDWIIYWVREGAEPRVMSGLLSIDENAPRTSLEIVQGGTVYETSALNLAPDHGQFQFVPILYEGMFELQVFADERGLRGVGQHVAADGSVQIPWSLVVGERPKPLVGANFTSVERPWPAAVTPEAVGLPWERVSRAASVADATRSAGFVILKDGLCVVFGGSKTDTDVNVSSVSKAINSLAVPLMLNEGLIDSIDEPLGPTVGWESGDPRGEITLRQVLSHTSGLEVQDYSDWFERARRSFSAEVRTARLVTKPGTTLQYNNQAFELIGLTTRVKSGLDLDTYLQTRLFDRIGIEATWLDDDEGHAASHGGLRISATDLAVVGEFLRTANETPGGSGLPSGWTEQMSQPQGVSQHFGLGWQLRSDGMFFHTGDTGAFLLVVPSRGLVVARTPSIRDPLGDAAVMREVMAIVDGVESH